MSRRAGLWSTVLLVWLAAAFLVLLPAQLGGSTSYLSTLGASMEPTYTQGDLVVLRPAPRYEVGDVVAYRSTTGRIFLHRIVDRDGQRFVLQGDNNTWLDGDRPTTADILGKARLRLAGVGRHLSALQEPRTIAVVTALVMFVAGGGVRLLRPAAARPAQRRTTRRSRMSRRPTPADLSFGLPVPPAAGRQAHAPDGVPSRPPHRSLPAPVPSGARDPGGPPAVPAAVVAAIVVTVVLTLWSFLSPAHRPATSEAAVTHQGGFSYAAAEAGGAAYPKGMRSGDPVFRRVVDQLEVTFTYAVASEAPTAVTGTYRLDLQVEDGSGWSQRMPLVAETSFRSLPLTTKAVVDLEHADRVLQALESATQLPPPNPTVSVVAEVTADVEVDGARGQEQFTASLPFAYQPLVLTLRSSGDDPREALVTSVDSAVRHSGTEPNRLALGPLTVPVTAARWGGAVATALALCAALLSVVRRRRLASLDESERIRRLHGARLLRIASPPVTPAEAVEVADFASLWRMAEHHDRMVLHVGTIRGDAYFVDDGCSVLAYYGGNRSQGDVLPAQTGHAAGEADGR